MRSGELEHRVGWCVTTEVAVDLGHALQCLEDGRVGFAAYEIKNALCALGLWREVNVRTGPLTVLNQKDGRAERRGNAEWLEVLRRDPWLRVPSGPD